ncbi:CBU_0592 family membrane protein [Nocardioides coralli]|uniref:CBU_0592 family membrane protein n=1 Tax=Nocardioides coralli TaxID=2872154 RepID=UPI001CA393E8|nr:hypothetical protein [Nocardioides coralli]QZY29747.1 hypothetical protein K6T13_03370 [Nocardioides coralli]
MLVVEMSGAAMVLLAFVLTQRGVPPRSLLILLLNAVGAGALSVIALLEERWGFLLLEGSWTLVALVTLWLTLRVRRGRPAHAG